MQMREMLCKCLSKLLETNSKYVIIDADLSKANGTFSLKNIFPDRVLNVGIAEQNMASVAAGLASYGFIPFILSFTPFVSRRICDQLAISIAYAGQNVKVIGTDPGICAELNGGTHMSVEDIAVIRAIPNFLICEPADCIELGQMIKSIAVHNGPCYMRMPRKERSDIYPESYEFELEKADIIIQGHDVTLISSGIMVEEAIAAAEKLKKFYDISSEVINLHTIKPLDKENILTSVKKTRCVVTCENHNILAGIGSCVAELLAQNFPVPINFVGIKDEFGEVGKLSELKSVFEMSSDDIVKQAISVIKRKQ